MSDSGLHVRIGYHAEIVVHEVHRVYSMSGYLLLEHIREPPPHSSHNTLWLSIVSTVPLEILFTTSGSFFSAQVRSLIKEWRIRNIQQGLTGQLKDQFKAGSLLHFRLFLRKGLVIILITYKLQKHFSFSQQKIHLVFEPIPVFSDSWLWSFISFLIGNEL